MWTKFIGCMLLTIFLNRDAIDGSVAPGPYTIHRHVEPGDNINISKNITIHRRGFGRFLGLLKLLKGLHHHKRQVYNPYVISKLWRASFEFELNPHLIPVYGHEMSSNIYFPTDLSVTGGGVVSNGKPSNSGLGSNSIDSIFHFGNNEQQSSVTIGGSNQITKNDERDEIPIGQNQVVQKESIVTVTNDTANEVAGKSERVLRHAIHGRIDKDESDDEGTTVSSSPFNTEGSETDDTSLPMPQTTIPTEASTPQTIGTTESLIPQTTILESTSVYPTTELANPDIEPVTGARPESSSTGAIFEPSSTSSTPRPTEWLGYYSDGIHKPEYIQSIELTTNYPPQLVSEDIHYVTYGAPFRPSRPDYSGNAYAYSTNFFNALNYFRR